MSANFRVIFLLWAFGFHLDRFLAQGSTFQEPMNPKLQVRWNPSNSLRSKSFESMLSRGPSFIQVQLTLGADIARTFPLSRAMHLLHIATSPSPSSFRMCELGQDLEVSEDACLTSFTSIPMSWVFYMETTTFQGDYFSPKKLYPATLTCAASNGRWLPSQFLTVHDYGEAVTQ
jgi:hypothetical protein